MIGRKIGRFRVLSKLGQGGMASVWKARDELLSRDVALKILDDRLADSEKTRRRFQHEARAAAALDHPGALAVYDSGEANGAVYIAMQLVDGETLSERVGRRLLPIEEAVRIVTAAADVLAHAHRRGIVHRDVTSRNIMVERDGRVFLMDFGLALATWESRLTSGETAMGTPPYMARELIAGGDADARSDVYGLGVVLYEALTGALPHPGDREATVTYSALHRAPVAPRERRPEIPEPIERIVLKAIACDPAERYQTAESFKAALEADAAVETREVRAAADDASVGAREPPSWPAPASTPRPHPLYLAILPFAVVEPGAGGDDETTAAARHLSECVGSALSRCTEVRVVPPGATSSARDPRLAASALGANALLETSVARSGSRLRVVYQVLDPWRGVLVAGDVVEGSIDQVFDLADRVVSSVTRVLDLTQDDPGTLPSSRPHDPAADDRYAIALGYLRRHTDEASVDGAIRLLEQLIASEGEVAAYYAALGRACVLKHRLALQHVWESRAASACERAKALAPDAPETRLALGDLELVAGCPESAQADYAQALKARPELWEAHVGMARALEALRRFPEAEAELRRAVELRPDDWRGHSALGVYLFNRGEFARAAEAWRRVTELAPDEASGWFDLGAALYRLDRLEDAAAHFRKATEIRPTAMAYSNLGTTLYFLGRHEEAVAALERATELSPLDAWLWGNVGNAYRWIPGHEAHAARALDRAIALGHEFLERNPVNAKVRARLAGWLANRNRAEEAREAICRALEIAPQDPECMVRAGHVHFQLGDRVEALRWIREAVHHGYGVAELRASQELAPLREDPDFQKILEEAPGRTGASSGTATPNQKGDHHAANRTA